MQNANEDKITLGYWALRGRGQVVRHLLSYLGLEFQQIQYKEVQQWFGKDKKNAGLDFPNLPWLKHGDFNLTQLDAICRYIIDVAGNIQLLGKTKQDQSLVTQLHGVIFDIITLTNVLFYDKEWESKLEATWQKVKPKIEYLHNFIKDRQTCLPYLTYADFVLAQLMCHYIPKLYPEKSETYPFLKNIRDYVQNLEGVKKYYERENAIKQPHLAWWFSAIKY